MSLKKIISLSLVVLWMIVIFLLSSEPGLESNNNSTKIANKVVEQVTSTPEVSKKTTIKLNKYIRKFAHSFEYMILSLLILNYLSKINKKNSLYYLITIILCFIYACSDEFHQLFVIGRTGCFRDTLIDTLGASIGTLIFLVITIIVNKIKFNTHTKNVK